MILKKTFFNLFEMFHGFTFTKLIYRHKPLILTYHRFSESRESRKLSKQTFEKQLTILSSHFNCITVQDLIEIYSKGKRIPNNTVCITIDDGYSDFHSIALPLLKKYNLPATLYIATKFIDQKIWLWPDLIKYNLDSTSLDNFNFELETKIEFNLKTPQDLNNAWHKIADYFLTIDNQLKISKLYELCQTLNIDVPQTPIKEYSAMTWDNIFECKQNNIEIGSHTLNHPILSNTSKGELDSEIKDSKTYIEEKIHQEVNSFCYPNGQKSDFNQETIDTVKNAKYSSAVTTIPSEFNPNDLYTLGRFSVSEDMLDFKKKIFKFEHLRQSISSF